MKLPLIGTFFILSSAASASAPPSIVAARCVAYDVAFYGMPIVFLLGLVHFLLAAQVGPRAAVQDPTLKVAFVVVFGFARWLQNTFHPGQLCATSGQPFQTISEVLLITATAWLIGIGIVTLIMNKPFETRSRLE